MPIERVREGGSSKEINRPAWEHHLCHSVIRGKQRQIKASLFKQKMEVVMLGKAMLMAGTIMVSSAVMIPAYADSADTMKTDDAVKADATEMKNDAKNEYEDAKEYSYEQKEDFMDWAKSKSDALGEKYDEMKDSAADNSDDAMDAVADAWEDAKDSISEAMDDVQDASADTWEDVKAETIAALNKAQNALDDEPDAQ
ncbi:hypothetical protein [Thalassospira sp. MCCC 1A01428]|uniref:hypothetical protein n=2 Tax=Thalassospira TaxID=168934 RepID=UPI001FED429E|nr:hypothetical protein [Thalassospira sp. MCCC 1A01428]